jgi:coproporphyrinogen III oxidase-like Fe-S oxidoreductase
MPDDDLMADMYLLVDQLCEEAGLSWYELSNWSKPGKECLHNIAYWKSSNWWGLGPGAHSHIDGQRWWKAQHATQTVVLFSAYYLRRQTSDCEECGSGLDAVCRID